MSLRVSVRFRDAVKLRVPTRESSKASIFIDYSLYNVSDLNSRTGVMMALVTWMLSGDGIGHLAGLTYASRLARF